MIPAKQIEILFVEDNPGDARFTRDGLKEGKLLTSLDVATNGAEAMEFLRQEGAFADSCRPNLILVDFTLPKKNGGEVLEEIKGDPDLRSIPVVTLTSPSDEQDIFQSYELHCTCYVTKPVDFDRFMEVGKSINEFWLTIVELPKKK